MRRDESCDTGEARLRLVDNALWLVSLSGAFSVLTGLQDHSLGVFAIGLGVLADVAGSAILIWRFRAERRQPEQSGAEQSGAEQSDAEEVRAAIVVAVALAIVSAVLTGQSVAALAS